MIRPHRFLFALSFLFTFLCARSVHAQTPGGFSSAGIDFSMIDSTISPCEDFYQYANGRWLSTARIPADRASWGTGSQLYEQNIAIIRDLLGSAARDESSPAGSIRSKVGRYYRTGMDSAGIEKAGIRPLARDLADIGSMRTAGDLAGEIASLHRRGISAAFGFFVYMDFKHAANNIAQLYQGGLAMPNMEYYTKTDEASESIKKKFVDHVKATFVLMGDGDAEAEREAASVMRIESALASASMRPVEERDPNAVYHIYTLPGLDSLAPQFPWKIYFTKLGLPGVAEVNVGQPSFLKFVARMADSVPMPEWRTYLRWQLVNAEAPRLASAFVDEDFRFNSGVIRGTKELSARWKRVLRDEDAALGEGVGRLFVEKTFPPAAKERAHTLVVNLQAALRDRIMHLDWISEETRKEALRKLSALMIKVGYPDQWRDYSALKIDGSTFVENGMQADEFEFQRNLDKIGKPLDRTEWSMTPSTVDAYYNPNFNEIVFPAGILQPPFFDMNADDAAIYGGIGTVIGHELTHGYDDQGRQFDAEGNLRDWWTKEDVDHYQGRASVIAKQYSGYLAVDTMHVNGELTLGENIADQGGVKIAYLAYRATRAGKGELPVINGFTGDQRFFLTFAQVWKRMTRPESVRLMILSDPHSPPRFRVIGSVYNLQEFSRAFRCSSGAMVNPQAGAAAIW
ncbi:MAG TPA: M13 family metallopeptidase [Bacteroidota bacterium]|nr:M13 family metallopeptidase [Bacteroidota bacterium]